MINATLIYLLVIALAVALFALFVAGGLWFISFLHHAIWAHGIMGQVGAIFMGWLMFTVVSLLFSMTTKQ